MSISVQPRAGGRHQLRVVHRLLPKAYFSTFEGEDSERHAREYGEQLHALLDAGILPGELVADAPKTALDPMLTVVILDYINKSPSLTDSDDLLLTSMVTEITGLRVSSLTYAWATGYVASLKKKELAPGTIRKRIGALGRVIDWYLSMVTPGGKDRPTNSLRLLPKGYSTYTRVEGLALTSQKKTIPVDVSRDHRLGPKDGEAILGALAGVKREDRERSLEPDPALRMLYLLIVDTGLRLREAYRLRVDQIDLQRRVIKVEGSKGHRGLIKPRLVPLKPRLAEEIALYLSDKTVLVFPYWDGSPEQLRRTTNRLSQRFSVLFDYAGLNDFTEHDLRHEATCRWVEMRGKNGHWMYGDVELCRIMGWTDTRMLLKYASLRGEDLSDRMLGVDA
jgi:integrase